MKQAFAALVFCIIVLCTNVAAVGQVQSHPRVLLFFSLNVENDHMLFATDALRFFAQEGDRHGFRVEATSDWNAMNEQNLKQYNLIVWLNGSPSSQVQREAFQRYMEGGGAWLGFHVAAYTDKDFQWTWFRGFIGAGVFGVNNWPPLPAKLIVDDQNSPITRGLPKTFVSPTNEWYSWHPSPRLAPNIHVLMTIDPANYPLGIKGLITAKEGDVPVVWTNTKYRMIYMNMGHGDKVFTSQLQNQFFISSIVWLLDKK